MKVSVNDDFTMCVEMINEKGENVVFCAPLTDGVYIFHEISFHEQCASVDRFKKQVEGYDNVVIVD